MAPYETDFHAGMTNSEVEAYLTRTAPHIAPGATYHGNQTLSVKIAEEPREMASSVIGGLHMRR